MVYKKQFNSEILFTGYYGHFNTGDDAFVEVASWGAEKYWGKEKNIFLARKERLPKALSNVIGYPFSIPKSTRLQNRLLLKSTKYLISAGGSTIHREIKPGNIKHLAMRMKSKGSNLKVGAIGVSVGPFNTIKDEVSTINYLKELDFLAVRDEESYNFVSNLHLPYQPINAFDLAALLPSIYPTNAINTNSGERKIIGVSVCPYESIVNENNIGSELKRNKDLVNLLRYLERNDNIHFKFIVFNGNPKFGDLKLTKDTIKKLSPKSYEIVNYNKSTQFMWRTVASCDFVITTRLHAAIFACFSDTPFMLNEYHRKCGDFLNNIGYDDKYRLYNSEYNFTEKAQIICEILNNPDLYNKPLLKNEMESRSLLNFTEVNI